MFLSILSFTHVNLFLTGLHHNSLIRLVPYPRDSICLFNAPIAMPYTCLSACPFFLWLLQLFNQTDAIRFVDLSSRPLNQTASQSTRISSRPFTPWPHLFEPCTEAQCTSLSSCPFSSILFGQKSIWTATKSIGNNAGFGRHTYRLSNGSPVAS